MSKSIFVLLLLSLFVFAGCYSSETATDSLDKENMRKSHETTANPASEFCLKMHGTVQIVQQGKDALAYCILPDASVCEEWDLFNGACSPKKPEELPFTPPC